MPLANIRILVVDNNVAQSERLTRPFPSWNWAFTRVPGDAAAALAALEAGQFELVLISLTAAERADYAFLRAWRNNPALAAIPVVITAWPGAPLSRLEQCIEHGATDYIIHPDHHVLLKARLQNILQRKLLQEQATTALEAFNEIEKIADDLRLVILPIGAALSVEEEYDRLLARIVEEAQRICNADAGALYLARDDGMLHVVFIRIESLNFTHQSAADGRELYPPIPLTDTETGGPNYASLPVFVAVGGESVNLKDMAGGRFDLGRLASFGAGGEFKAETCLAVPLRSGQVVGSLLLANSRDPLSNEIVPFDGYHQQVAESLASQAAIVLNNRLLSERQAHLMRFKRELEIGREIQLSFLPSRLPTPDGWDISASYQPSLEVAGDFYDAFFLPHGFLVLAIADVVGKGVTAALFMAIIRSLFRALFQQNYFAAEITAAAPGAGRTTPFPFVDRTALLNAIRLTNAYLIANHADTYAFATLFAAVLDPDTGRLLYVNAGHNPPLLMGPCGDGRRAVRQELSPTGPAIGLMAGALFYLGETIIQPGELLFAFTDGVTEGRDPSGAEFGQERLQALLAECSGSAATAIAAVESAVKEHAAGAEAFDDVTMLALQRHDPQ